ncbi:MAG: DUF4912 domain-containing protein [Chitinispirillaceae bacterium]|nr:DUF4912 domain-containing protein [Chitinispirillaceae bacterium]
MAQKPTSKNKKPRAPVSSGSIRTSTKDGSHSVSAAPSLSPSAGEKTSSDELYRTQGNPASLPFLPFSRDIPSMYNETYLRVIPRDESHLFSFWEIAPDAYDKARKKQPGVSLKTSTSVMRVYEVRESRDARSTSVLAEEITLDESEQSRYVPTPEHGGTWCVGIGLKSPSGTYVEFCRSQEVSLPAAGRSAAESPGRDFSHTADESMRSASDDYVYNEDSVQRNESGAGTIPVETQKMLSQATSPVKPFAREHQSSVDV